MIRLLCAAAIIAAAFTAFSRPEPARDGVSFAAIEATELPPYRP